VAEVKCFLTLVNVAYSKFVLNKHINCYKTWSREHGEYPTLIKQSDRSCPLHKQYIIWYRKASSLSKLLFNLVITQKIYFQPDKY